MTRSEKALQKRIVQFHLNYVKSKKNVIVDCFLKEKIPYQTIYSIIGKYEQFDYIGDKPRSSRPKKIASSTVKSTEMSGLIIRLVFLHQLATKFEVSHENIYNYLEEMNIKYEKKNKKHRNTLINKWKKYHFENVDYIECR